MESQAESNILQFAKKRNEQGDVSEEAHSLDEATSVTRAQNLLDNTAGLERPGLHGSAPSSSPTSVSRKYVVDVAVDDISLSPFQTREISSDDELAELRSSVSTHGVIQPIIVRELPLEDERDTSYELVAGERRLRAAVLAGLERIPALVQPLSDQQSLEVSIIENAQRQNLNAIEEAQAYQLLADRFHMNQSDIAKTVGKNRSSVSNSLRLLQLQPEVIDLLKAEELSAGHGRALLMIADSRTQIRLAWRAVHRDLSVRALEELARRIAERAEDREEEKSKEDLREEQSLRRIESKLCETLGIEKARLRLTPDGMRQVTLHFETEASWRRFMGRIKD